MATSPHPKRERSRSSRPGVPWETVGGEDDLLACLVQGVEGVEELLLGALLAGEELDIVDDQR